MGGSRIFDLGGPFIEEVRDDGQNMALFALKYWSIGGGIPLEKVKSDPKIKSNAKVRIEGTIEKKS